MTVVNDVNHNWLKIGWVIFFRTILGKSKMFDSFVRFVSSFSQMVKRLPRCSKTFNFWYIAGLYFSGIL